MARGGGSGRHAGTRRDLELPRAATSTGGVALEAWYDSLELRRRSGDQEVMADTDGLIGGRYRGLLAPDGHYSEHARPFVPDEVAESPTSPPRREISSRRSRRVRSRPAKRGPTPPSPSETARHRRRRTAADPSPTPVTHGIAGDGATRRYDADPGAANGRGGRRHLLVAGIRTGASPSRHPDRSDGAARRTGPPAGAVPGGAARRAHAAAARDCR